MTAKHGYIYGSGMSGCLYDYGPHWAATAAEAEADLLTVFHGLSNGNGGMVKDLRASGIHYFKDPAEAGADYAEITEATAEQAAQFQERSHEILT